MQKEKRVDVLLDLQLCDILEDHVDIIIKVLEGSCELLLRLHDDPDLGSNARVNQF